MYFPIVHLTSLLTLKGSSVAIVSIPQINCLDETFALIPHLSQSSRVTHITLLVRVGLSCLSSESQAVPKASWNLPQLPE